jgi:type VI secretion system secreted protein VgrG
MTATQKNRPIQIATPLGDDVLLFYRMSGHEQLSQLFEYELELLSENSAITPESLLGENVTIGLMLPDDKQRFFNGYVSRFGQYGTLGELTYYRASVRPWLWFLSRAANCRIFQGMTTPDIVKQVFTDQAFGGEFDNKLMGTYQPREYCVQYRETDFNFVSRLMEEEGIYYYFTHDNGKHKLVLADAKTTIDPYPGYQDIPFHQDQGRIDSLIPDYINQWGFAKEVQSGGYSLTDFDPSKPKASLKAVSNKPNSHKHAKYEVFDYPGYYNDVGVGDDRVNIRLEELQVRFERFEGAGNARGLAVGNKFSLTGYPLEEQNREYLIVSALYHLENDDYSTSSQADPKPFTCSFASILAKTPYHPPRGTPKPLVHGAQTALVTGPSGDEIHTDKYGRVKVQFHWDRFGKADENSSCWVRVSHPWAGKNWGMIALPRIGQEVIVDFMEGDPDQPIITGRVYNDSSMPPYPLPAKAFYSTIKTNSTKGGGGFNELRFNDDKGNEQIFIHAERNQDIRVKKDHFEWIGNERHLIVKKDLLEEIDGDHHSTIKGDSNLAVTGTISIKVDQDMQEKVGMKHALDAGQEIHLKAGMNIVLEASTNITLKVGGSFVTVGPEGVSISGPMVNINSGGSAGSGSGCSPDAPKVPKEAADDKEGSVDDVPTAAPATPAGYGPSATVLKMAAQNGTPFCEQCAAAAAAQAAGSSSAGSSSPAPAA